MRIDAWLPSYDLIDTVQRHIDARPEEVYRALQELDSKRSLWLRAFFPLRRPRRDFILLEENPGEEFVMGAVGRFWRLDRPLEDVTREEFRAFHQPGVARLVWNMRVEPRGRGAHAFAQVRIAVPDEATRRRLGVYWAFVGPVSHAIRWGALESVARKLEPRRHVPIQRVSAA